MRPLAAIAVVAQSWDVCGPLESDDPASWKHAIGFTRSRSVLGLPATSTRRLATIATGRQCHAAAGTWGQTSTPKSTSAVTTLRAVSDVQPSSTSKVSRSARRTKSMSKPSTMGRSPESVSHARSTASKNAVVVGRSGSAAPVASQPAAQFAVSISVPQQGVDASGRWCQWAVDEEKKEPPAGDVSVTSSAAMCVAAEVTVAGTKRTNNPSNVLPTLIATGPDGVTRH